MTPCTRDCPPPSITQCHCARCHVSFGSLDDFDRHLIHEPRSVVVTGCESPESMGLVRDDRRVWRTPEGLARRNLDVARLAALRRPGSGSGSGPTP